MSSKGRILVTGGAGFLGSHLCDRFLAEGYQVICLDNLLTGRSANVEHCLDNPAFTMTGGDVTKPLNIEMPVDFVVHFASPASPKDYAQHPIHTLKVGALGTYHALGLAKSKSSVFLLASSSEIYGDPQVNPQDESYWGNVNPIGPRSMYDEAKRYAEALSVAYYKQHGVDVRIARIFNTYGPRMRLNDGRALPSFMTQSLAGEPLAVYGDGSQTRSFCYVDDLVEGLLRLLMAKGAESSDPLVVNLGNPEEVTILELAREVIHLAGSSSRIEFEPLPVDDPKIRRPDISRAKRLLSWEPKVSRAEGLQRTLEYFRSAMASRAA